jgi:hypothetical protein
VNPDARESRLARWDEAGRERWLALQPQPGAVQAAGTTSTTERLIPIWFWLLLVAAALSFLEPLVAKFHLHVRRVLST